jgi:hypothetical protein
MARTKRGPASITDESTAQPPTEQPNAEQAAMVPTETISPSENLAGHLRETIAPLFMNASLGRALPQTDTTAFRLYRNKLPTDCGGPTDPIEVMLIEQLALAHLNMGLLHCKASNAGSVQCAAAYSGAASRLMGEFRRSAIALQAYRAASVRLAEMAEADPKVPTGEVIEHHDEPQGDHINGEIGATAEDNHDGPAPSPSGAARRSEANRRNRAKWHGFTPERLERLRAATLANQPWRYNTGPRTPEGEAGAGYLPEKAALGRCLRRGLEKLGIGLGRARPEGSRDYPLPLEERNRA